MWDVLTNKWVIGAIVSLVAVFLIWNFLKGALFWIILTAIISTGVSAWFLWPKNEKQQKT